MQPAIHQVMTFILNNSWRLAGGDCITRKFRDYLDDKVKEDEMGLTCSTHESEDKFIQNFRYKS